MLVALIQVYNLLISRIESIRGIDLCVIIITWSSQIRTTTSFISLWELRSRLLMIINLISLLSTIRLWDWWGLLMKISIGSLLIFCILASTLLIIIDKLLIWVVVIRGLGSLVVIMLDCCWVFDIVSFINGTIDPVIGVLTTLKAYLLLFFIKVLWLIHWSV